MPNKRTSFNKQINYVSLSFSKALDMDYDALRQVGDPVADEILETIPQALQQQELSKRILSTSTFDVQTAKQLDGIRSFFGKMMPFSGLVLLCGSLPAAYSAAKGATILRCTGRLQKEPRLRIMETSFFLSEIFEHPYLENNQPVDLKLHSGFQAVVKVRLLHARVRQHVMKATSYNCQEMGIPINQEDMMGTLTVFSYVLLLGLSRLGIKTSAQERESYATFWNIIGNWMGVQHSFQSLHEQEKVCQQIFERQCTPDLQSKLLVQNLFKKVIPPQLSELKKRKLSRAFSTLTHMLDKELALRLELECSVYHIITWKISIWMFQLILLVDSLLLFCFGISLRQRTGKTMRLVAKKVMNKSGVDSPFEFRLA